MGRPGIWGEPAQKSGKCREGCCEQPPTETSILPCAPICGNERYRGSKISNGLAPISWRGESLGSGYLV
jgi:hypothetical protein